MILLVLFLVGVKKVERERRRQVKGCYNFLLNLLKISKLFNISL